MDQNSISSRLSPLAPRLRDFNVTDVGAPDGSRVMFDPADVPTADAPPLAWNGQPNGGDMSQDTTPAGEQVPFFQPTEGPSYPAPFTGTNTAPRGQSGVQGYNGGAYGMPISSWFAPS